MNIQPRDRALLGVVAVLAVCAAFYLLVIGPEHRTESRLQTQIATAQASLAGAEQQEATGHSAEVFLRNSQGEWATAQRAVPRVSNIPALLKLLEHSAQAASVTMESVALTGAGGDSSAGSGSTAAASTTDHGATTIPVGLTFEGGYQALNRLVHHLDTLVSVSHGHLDASGPLVGISNVQLSPSSGGSKHNPVLSVQLTATIYQHSAGSTVLGSDSEGS
jgi:hypothetical protein